MTIIVGVVRGSTSTIGADSRYTAGSSIAQCNVPKLWRQGPFVLGVTGSTREGQILRYATTIPTPPDDPAKVMAWLAVDVINVIRDARKASGFAEVKGDGTEIGPHVMIIHRGRLFVVYPDYMVAEFLDSAAIGSGMDFALGALAVTKRAPAKPRVRVALQAACDSDAYCAPPFTIYQTRAKR